VKYKLSARAFLCVKAIRKHVVEIDPRSTYLPLVAHPIIYFCLCSEYRVGGLNGVRALCGCPVPTEDQKATMSKYKEEEILASRSTISKTQVSNIL
jgi:hypothetical protein